MPKGQLEKLKRDMRDLDKFEYRQVMNQRLDLMKDIKERKRNLQEQIDSIINVDFI